VTGRPRRCGWFDAAGLKRVVDINGISGLCITKLDVLDGLDVVRVAVGYKVRGERRDKLPVGADALASCEPVYEEYPGWKESTVGIKSFDALPKNAQVYLRRLEALVGAPVDIISTGPDRVETIVLRHPFD
jgi:adenylosuccinate synthase